VRSILAQNAIERKIDESSSCARARRNVWCLALRASAIFAKRDDRFVGTAEEARVETRKLLIDHAYELLVARRLGAVGSRGNDASADIVSVAWVLAVGDRCSDELSLVRDAGRLGKVDHLVGVVLLVANATRREEGVDAINAGQVDAWLVREDVTAAGETEILPVLRDSRKVRLHDATVRGVMEDRTP